MVVAVDHELGALNRDHLLEGAASLRPRPSDAPLRCGGWWIITTRAWPAAFAASSAAAERPELRFAAFS